MSKPNVMIFSKNRACQLDGLLTSIEHHAPIFNKVVVVYRATDEEYERGYNLLRKFQRKIPFIYWQRENAQTTRLDRTVRQFVNTSETLCFLVDDDMFYRPAPAIIKLPFSFRLGVNTIYCHPEARRQNLPNFYPAGDGSYTWDWTQTDGDFGYPFSLDGTVYAREMIQDAISKVEFPDPTIFEAAMWYHSDELGFRQMYCREHSCLVNLPHNRVTESAFNPVSGIFSTSFLNEAFLSGRRINPYMMDFSNVQGAHQEIPYSLELDLTTQRMAAHV